MKKNYIVPSTVAATWSSMGLMQGPTIGMSTGSGAEAQSTGSPLDVD
jgi:hypothetical protein